MGISDILEGSDKSDYIRQLAHMSETVTLGNSKDRVTWLCDEWTGLQCLRSHKKIIGASGIIHTM